MNNILEQIEYKLFRLKLARKLAGNLGKVVIESDRIICYVDKKKIEGKRRLNFCYPMDFENTFLLERYNLDKPVCFIVDGANFDKGLHFTSSKNTKIIFKECSFGKSIEIVSVLGEVVFENNSYFQPSENTKLFLKVNASSITFINDYLVNHNGYLGPTQMPFNLDIKVDNLIIQNSLVYAGNVTDFINIEAKKMSLIDSIIDFPIAFINADKINSSGSNIFSDMWINIVNKNRDKLPTIESPKITYNLKDFTGNTKPFVVKKESYELFRSRVGASSLFSKTITAKDLSCSERTEKTYVKK